MPLNYNPAQPVPTDFPKCVDYLFCSNVSMWVAIIGIELGILCIEVATLSIIEINRCLDL